MKKPFIFIAIAVITFLSTSYTNDTPIDVMLAIKDKKAEFTFTSNGKFRGQSVIVDVKNLTDAPLTISIPAGTTFIPEDEGQQTLILPRQQMITLLKSQIKKIILNGFCTEMHDRCPKEASIFTIGKTENTALKEFVTFIKPLMRLDESAIQESIWCITDSNMVSNVYNTDLTTGKNLRAFLCKKTGQTDTWYATRREHSIGSDGNILNHSHEVKGKITFKTTVPTVLTGVVKNEAGQVMWTYPNPIELPVGEIEFEFGLTVRTFPHGKYSVVYTSADGKEFVHYNFRI